MSKRACRARTAAPVAMEMSRRFMGRLSLTRGARTMRRAQSVLPPVPRPAGRKPTGRAETGGKDARGAPCVARAHALPTRGSARRTIGYAVRSPAAPGHPLLCGMAPLMPWCDRGAPRALALTPISQAGAILMRVCRPLPPAAGEANRRGGGRQGRARALRARPPGAPCVRRGRANSPRIPYRRAEAHAADQRGRACILRPIFCRFMPIGADHSLKIPGVLHRLSLP